jgi:hypothetical protein
MRRASQFAILLAAALLLGGAPVAAQVSEEKPVKASNKQPTPRIEKFKGQVLYANVMQITVQSVENTAFVRTFTYSPKLAERMQKLAEQGGYQPGDKVEVHFEAGGNVAVRIKGKPSKPL